MLYLAFVCSNLEYASEVWAPQSSITDLKPLEGVQRRATRFILGCHPHHQLRPDYKSRLLALRLLPLLYYLECRDLRFMYKCLNNLVDFQYRNYISFCSGRTRRSAELDLRPLCFRTTLFRNSYFNRIVLIWNHIPISIRQASSYASFKSQLKSFYFEKLEQDFHPLQVRTWKTVCPYCRSINYINCC